MSKIRQSFSLHRTLKIHYERYLVSCMKSLKFLCNKMFKYKVSILYRKGERTNVSKARWLRQNSES